MYRIKTSKLFVKSMRKLSQQEQKAVSKKIEILIQNPFHPSLRTKKVQRLISTFECSVNMNIRILWQYDGDTIILLINVGHHDIL